MANIIKPKRSNTAAKVPNTTELTSGELGVNMADRKVYINNGTAVVQVGAGNLSGLGDVAIATPTNGQSLTYNSTTSKWQNSTAGTGTVTSVGITPGTGVTVSGSPVTTSGNISVGLSTKLTAIENLSGAGFITQNGSGAIAGRTLQAGTGISIAHGNGSSQDPVITNSAPDQTVALTGAGATTVSGTYPNFTITSVNTTYGAATSTVPGLIELGSDTAQTVAANAVSATASRSYALQVNAAGQGVVNVPWTDTNSGGTVTSVSGTGTASGLSLSGTVTTSGSLTLSGTVNSLAAGTYAISISGNAATATNVNYSGLTGTVPTWNQNTTGSAATLATGRTIAMTGDVTYTSGSFDGSANVTGAATLANSGVTAGTYTKVTVNAKGLTTSGTTLAASDIPELTMAKLPGAAYKESVRCATTANITLSGTQTIDGIAVVAGNRVLVKNQTTASQNGIYVVAAGAWTRSLDANAADEIGAAVVNVDSGTANGGELWTTTFKTTDTLGTTAMNWYEVLYNTGTWGISISGSAATLTTARTIQTNLASTTAASFNGSANITPGVTGTLAIANGGTGATTAAAARTNLGAASTSLATSTVPGLIELGSDTAQTVAPNAVSATASRSYALQLNAAGQGVVNVPWTDTNSGGTVTSVASGTGLTGGPITTTGTLSLANTTVTAGSYTYANITVDAQGRLTAASSGAAPSAFPAGTAMMFVQTAAPTGWTKSTTHDNKALRVVSGTASSGGTTAFTSVFTNQTVSTSISISGTSGSTTLSTSQMPSHQHSGGATSGSQGGFSTGTIANANTGFTGGGGSHNHSFSGSGSGTSSAVTLNVQYVDVIIATKD